MSKSSHVSLLSIFTFYSLTRKHDLKVDQLIELFNRLAFLSIMSILSYFFFADFTRLVIDYLKLPFAPTAYAIY
jgi:hypothetical protein